MQNKDKINLVLMMVYLIYITI